MAALRGKILIAHVTFTSNLGGPQDAVNIDVLATNISGVRQKDFLDASNGPISFLSIEPKMDNASVVSVKLSIIYSNGGVEISPELSFNGDFTMVSWSQETFDLWDPSPQGDDESNAVYVLGTLRYPNPIAKP